MVVEAISKTIATAEKQREEELKLYTDKFEKLYSATTKTTKTLDKFYEHVGKAHGEEIIQKSQQIFQLHLTTLS